jgi:hypothetical protein
MNDQHDPQDNLIFALRELTKKWVNQAQEADQKGRQMGIGNVQQALYQRGIAEGLRVALADIEALLTGDDQMPDETILESYSVITRDEALALLGQIGLHISELHQHKDQTFSAILAPLQVLTFEERVHKLSGIADVIILAKGRLPNSTKAYIDFAFRKSTTT